VDPLAGIVLVVSSLLFVSGAGLAIRGANALCRSIGHPCQSGRYGQRGIARHSTPDARERPVYGLSDFLNGAATDLTLIVRGAPRDSAKLSEMVLIEELETGQLPVLIACSNCGKKLKVRAESAGKKVKHAQCGKAVLAPED
jgi:hypothetical protein